MSLFFIILIIPHHKNNQINQFNWNNDWGPDEGEQRPCILPSAIEAIDRLITRSCIPKHAAEQVENELGLVIEV